MNDTSSNSSYDDAPLLNLLSRPLSDMSTEELRAHVQQLLDTSSKRDNLSSPARHTPNEPPERPASQKQILSSDGCARVPQCKDDICDEYIICDECDYHVMLEDLRRGLCCPCGHLFDNPSMYNSLGEGSSIRSCCAKCQRELGNEPIILIDDEFYCFSDAKLMYPKLEASRRNREKALNTGYEQAKAKYDQAIALEDGDMRAWKYKQSSYIEDSNFTKWKWAWYVLAVILSFIANPALGILITFVGLFVVLILDGRVCSDRAAQFAIINPPPEQKAKLEDPPKYKWLPGLSLAVYDVNNSADQIGAGYNRATILKRDNSTCQNCRKKFQAELLEIHHVTPKSKGGSDSIRNLTTLCLKCHMKEDWFGHFHKNRRDFGL